MPLEAAKCPSFGAQIQIPGENETTYCAYCGSAIRTQAAIAYRHIRIEGIETLEEQLKNAETFLKLGNQHQAKGIFSKISQKYPNDYRAWWALAKLDLYPIYMYEDRISSNQYYHNALLVANGQQKELIRREIEPYFTTIQTNIRKRIEFTNTYSQAFKNGDYTALNHAVCVDGTYYDNKIVGLEIINGNLIMMGHGEIFKHKVWPRVQISVPQYTLHLDFPVLLHHLSVNMRIVYFDGHELVIEYNYRDNATYKYNYIKFIINNCAPKAWQKAITMQQEREPYLLKISSLYKYRNEKDLCPYCGGSYRSSMLFYNSDPICRGCGYKKYFSDRPQGTREWQQTQSWASIDTCFD